MPRTASNESEPPGRQSTTVEAASTASTECTEVGYAEVALGTMLRGGVGAAADSVGAWLAAQRRGGRMRFSSLAIASACLFLSTPILSAPVLTLLWRCGLASHPIGVGKAQRHTTDNAHLHQFSGEGAVKHHVATPARFMAISALASSAADRCGIGLLRPSFCWPWRIWDFLVWAAAGLLQPIAHLHRESKGTLPLNGDAGAAATFRSELRCVSSTSI
eukprot:scaffold230749_cov32-Tisochrysis_lutea.AAC.1